MRISREQNGGSSTTVVWLLMLAWGCQDFVSVLETDADTVAVSVQFLLDRSCERTGHAQHAASCMQLEARRQSRFLPV